MALCWKFLRANKQTIGHDQCIIFIIPDKLGQNVYLEIPVKDCFMGMLLTCPIAVYQHENCNGSYHIELFWTARLYVKAIVCAKYIVRFSMTG